MTDAVQAAIAAAREAAAALPAEAAPSTQTPGAMTAPASAQSGGAIVAAGSAPAVTLDEIMQAGGMNVKGFIKVDKLGFIIGSDNNPHDDIAVGLVLDEARPHYALRFTVGDKTTYRKSLNRQVDAASGRPWAQAIAEAQGLDPKCRGDYPAVDVPVVILTEIKNKKGDTVLAEPGDRFGITTSVTNFNLFRDFKTAMTKMGVTNSEPIIGKIVHESKKSNGNTWGLCHWKDFAPVSRLGDAGATVLELFGPAYAQGE